MRALFLAVFLVACRREPEAQPDEPRRKPKKLRTPCALATDAPITKTVEIVARCEVAIDREVHVAEGGRLVIGAGARLVFAAEAGITVEGGALIARGSSDDRIVFSGREPSPGGWRGLAFPPLSVAASDSVESVVEHAVIEHAGGARAGVSGGVVVTARGGTRVRFAHVLFRDNAERALYVYDVKSWARGEDLVFHGNRGFSFDGDPDVLAESTNLELGEPVHLWGIVTRKLVLPRAPAYGIRRLLVYGDQARDPSVVFPDGALVRVDTGGEIRVGTAPASGRACALVARRATFTSGAKSPRAGDWGSIFIDDDCTVTLDGSTVEYANKGVQIAAGAAHVSLERVTFRDVAGVAIESQASCTPWLEPARGISAKGKLCEEVPPGLGLSGAFPFK